MVFSEPGQILACLEAIAADSEVEVVRINNKLARDYDAGITAGYRCAAPATSNRSSPQTPHGMCPGQLVLKGQCTVRCRRSHCVRDS